MIYINKSWPNLNPLYYRYLICNRYLKYIYVQDILCLLLLITCFACIGAISKAHYWRQLPAREINGKRGNYAEQSGVWFEQDLFLKQFCTWNRLGRKTCIFYPVSSQFYPGKGIKFSTRSGGVWMKLRCSWTNWWHPGRDAEKQIKNY